MSDDPARLFAHECVARGYATARPRFHPEVVGRIERRLGRRGLGPETVCVVYDGADLASMKDDVRAPLFDGEERLLRFGGYIWYLRRL